MITSDERDNQANKNLSQIRVARPSCKGCRQPNEHLDRDDAMLLPEDDVDLKAPMNPRERSFMELYFFSGKKISQHEAAKKAGYKGKSKQALCNTARRIIQKFESLTDTREIFRRIGLGEIQVALKIKELMNDPSKTIQARATELAAKIMGMTKETIDLQQGIQIVIKAPDGRPIQPPGQAVQPIQTQAASLPPAQPRVRMIK